MFVARDHDDRRGSARAVITKRAFRVCFVFGLAKVYGVVFVQVAAHPAGWRLCSDGIAV